MTTQTGLGLKLFALSMAILVSWVGYLGCLRLFSVTTPSGMREIYHGPEVFVCFGLDLLIAALTYVAVIHWAQRIKSARRP